MKNGFFARPVVLAGAAALCCALWGSAFPFIKLGYAASSVASSDTAAQILYAGCRFTLVGILALLLGCGARRRMLLPASRRSVGPILLLALLQAVLQYTFFYIGMAHSSGVSSSIINSANVFLSVFVSALVFRMEKLTGRKLLGCLVGFAGVVLVNVWGSSSGAGFAWNGEGFVFLSGICYAFAAALIKRYSGQEDPLVFSSWPFILGGAVLTGIGLALGGRLSLTTPAAVGILVYLAFASAVAYSLWNLLLQSNPLSRVAVFGFLTPVFGVVLSFLLLDEGSRLSPVTFIALALVCAGILIVNRGQKPGPAAGEEN